MSRKNRIQKNYYLKGPNGRGSLWTIWLTPVLNGPNDIYFAGSGYLREKADAFGFEFHLSFHKDGRSHLKYQNSKIHLFSVTDPSNFPICSVYTHLEDLIVPQVIPDKVIGDKISIEIEGVPNPGEFEWSEFFVGHFETPRAEDFIKKFQAEDFDFNVIDRISIGQDREILIMFRFIESTATSGAKPDLSRLKELDHKNRLTVWGYRDKQSKHVAIHDLSPNIDRIEGVYK